MILKSTVSKNRKLPGCTTLLVLICFSTGCYSPVRLCPEFNHPLAREFSTVDIGESMMFTSSTGVVINYRLDSIESSEQHLGSHTVADVSDIECKLTSEHTYISSELGTTLSLEFEQVDIVGISPGDQGLGLYTEIAISGGRGGSGFLFSLSNLTAEQGPENDYSSHTLRYFERKVFGQTEYPDVSEYRQSPDSFVFVSDAPVETRLSRMAISKGAGIVEFEQADGVVYTRVPP